MQKIDEAIALKARFDGLDSTAAGCAKTNAFLF